MENPQSINSHSRRRANIGSLILVFIVILAMRYTGVFDKPGGKLMRPVDSSIPVSIERVVDGDTLVLNFQGDKVRCRLIGIDAPESVAANPERITEEGKYASRYLEALIQQFRGEVFIEFDEERYDQHGRLLAYVWLDNLLLNEYLCLEGVAEAKEYPPNLRYQTALRDAMQYAQTKGLGIWEK